MFFFVLVRNLLQSLGRGANWKRRQGALKMAISHGKCRWEITMIRGFVAASRFSPSFYSPILVGWFVWKGALLCVYSFQEAWAKLAAHQDCPNTLSEAAHPTLRAYCTLQ